MNNSMHDYRMRTLFAYITKISATGESKSYRFIFNENLNKRKTIES